VVLYNSVIRLEWSQRSTGGSGFYLNYNSGF